MFSNTKDIFLPNTGLKTVACKQFCSTLRIRKGGGERGMKGADVVKFRICPYERITQLTKKKNYSHKIQQVLDEKYEKELPKLMAVSLFLALSPHISRI